MEKCGGDSAEQHGEAKTRSGVVLLENLPKLGGFTLRGVREPVAVGFRGVAENPLLEGIVGQRGTRPKTLQALKLIRPGVPSRRSC